MTGELMRRWLRLGILLTATSLIVAAGDATAADSADLLAMIPAPDSAAALLIVVEKPRSVLETTQAVAAYQSALQSLPAVREALDATPVRRLKRLLRFFESELQAEWPVLVDKVAGGGLALLLAVGPNPPPSLLIIHGTDEACVRNFQQRALLILDEESTRQGGPSLTRQQHLAVEVASLGNDFHSSRVGRTLLISNQRSFLNQAISHLQTADRKQSLAGRSGPAEARTLLGGNPLAWLWFDFARIKQEKPVQDFFANSRKDLFQTLVAGATIDALRRAEYIAASLDAIPGGYSAKLQLPVRRADLAEGLTLHVPSADKPGSLPLLLPKQVIYSQSFHLDLGDLWRKRETIINPQQRRQIEEGAKQVTRVLPNTSVAELLEHSGPYHRFVLAHRVEKLYSREPGQPLPAGAYVMSGCGEKFGKIADAGLRAAALLAGLPYGLTMHEEQYDGTTIVSYRFSESKPIPDDPEQLRFNAAPCFAMVADSLIVASHPGLLKDLIGELRSPRDQQSPAVWRNRLDAAGVAASVRSYPQQTITTTILSDGVSLSEARRRVDALVEWIQTLGHFEIQSDHEPETFKLQFRWISSPAAAKVAP
jgi:hypothetical protein